MKERVRRELELVELQFGELELDPNLDWFIVKHLPLPDGWNKTSTQVLILLPGGYPTTPPDNFCTDCGLRLSDGKEPANASSQQQVAGQAWLQFSYHVEAAEWKPDPDVPENGHNLVTFLSGVTRRLSEVN